MLVLAGVGVLVARGSSEPAPANGAAALVPADALAYINLSTDRSRPAVKRALRLARRLPQVVPLSSVLQSQFQRIAGGTSPVSAGQVVSPWLGKEVALAVLDTSSSAAGVVIAADVGHPARARDALTAAGAVPAGSYRGRSLWRLPSGTQAAFVRHFLVVGTPAGVDTAIDVAAGAVPSLQDAAAYIHASADEPAGRFVEAYASAAGVRRLLGSRGGLLGALGVLLDQPSLTAVTVSASAQSPGLRLRVHSALDPRLSTLNGGPAAPLAPTLQHVIPAGSALMLDARGLSRLAGRVLAAGAAGGIVGRVGPLLGRLGNALGAEGVNVASVLSIFSGETAVVIGPAGTGVASAPAQAGAGAQAGGGARAGGGAQARGGARAGGGAQAGAGTPAVAIVARTSHPGAARAALASLAVPLAQLLAPAGSSSSSSPGAGLTQHQVGSETVEQISLSPGLQLDYAVTNDLVIVSTQLRAVASVIERKGSLSSDAGYRATLPDSPTGVTSLLFLDFSQLLYLGEQTGLTQGTRYRALAADLARIRAAGLESTGGEADTTAELLLQIS